MTWLELYENRMASYTIEAIKAAKATLGLKYDCDYNNEDNFNSFVFEGIVDINPSFKTQLIIKDLKKIKILR